MNIPNITQKNELVQKYRKWQIYAKNRYMRERLLVSSIT